MTAKIYIDGIIGNGKDQFGLKNVISQFNAFENPTSVEFIIDSVGGSVEVGESIGKYIENLKIPTTTIAIKAYSIAATIFMSAETRLVDTTNENPLMIHMPLIPEFSGRSEDFQLAADYLKKEEKRFTDFYATKIQIDKETIHNLLSQETFITSDEAISMGLATGVREAKEFKAVAFYDNEHKKQMTKKDKFFKAIEAFFKPETVALVLQDATGLEITFPDLTESDTPQVGNKAEIDGSPAEGEYVAPDGSTWVFAGGELTEVRPSEEETEESEVSTETEAVAEEISEISKWEISVVQDSFELGTKIEYRPEGDEDPKSVGAGEYELSDGRKILTDSEGVVRFIKEAEGSTTEQEEDFDSDAILEGIAEAVAKKLQAKETEAVNALQTELTALKKTIGSVDLDTQAQDNSTKKLKTDLPKSAQILATLKK